MEGSGSVSNGDSISVSVKQGYRQVEIYQLAGSNKDHCLEILETRQWLGISYATLFEIES